MLKINKQRYLVYIVYTIYIYNYIYTYSVKINKQWYLVYLLYDVYTI